MAAIGRTEAGNLGTQEQNARLRKAIWALAASLILTVVLIETRAPHFWRVGLFIPFFGTAFAALQGLYRTCYFAGKKGIRCMDDGEVPVGDKEVRKRLRSRGLKIMLGSILSAALVTGLILLIP